MINCSVAYRAQIGHWQYCDYPFRMHLCCELLRASRTFLTKVPILIFVQVLLQLAHPCGWPVHLTGMTF